MKKILVVSPHFCPVSAPDLQRVRLALPHLRALGWEPTVLAFAPDTIESPALDPLQSETYPSDIRIIRVHGFSPRFTRALGFGALWLRAGRALRLAGERLLRAEKFDLVFFSTTQFGAFTLGPRWKRHFGVPYVLDYQDPWVNNHYARTGQPPPGGRLRFALSHWLARRREPAVLRQAAGIIAVSAAYGPMLAAGNPGFDPARVSVIPFGASAQDFAIARRHAPASPLVPFGDGCIHLVYTGRGGADLRTALTILFRAFKRFRELDAHEAARMRFHFIGTSYAPSPLGRETVMPVARAEGVAAQVHEHCARVPYFESLYYLAHADAVLALGSDDPGYSASKIFPCLLARRPLLALFHQDCPVLELVRRTGGRESYGFSCEPARDEALVARIATEWFAAGAISRPVNFDAAAFAPYTAESMTRSLAACFDQAASSVTK